MWTQGLASAHATEGASELLRKEKFARVSLMPKGADCNPLGCLVWTSTKKELKRATEAQRDNLAKLQATIVQIANKLRSDPVWIGRATNSCESASTRLRWVLETGGGRSPENRAGWGLGRT